MIKPDQLREYEQHYKDDRKVLNIIASLRRTSFMLKNSERFAADRDEELSRTKRILATTESEMKRYRDMLLTICGGTCGCVALAVKALGLKQDDACNK